MEKKIKIKTKDDHLIYGTLNTPTKASSKLIIFVHGLTGDQDEHIFYNAAKFFPKKEFVTFRFDLYSGEKKGRSLSKTTIKIHAKDLDKVVDYFRNKFKKIFVVGHSMGGPTILLSKTKEMNGIILWDPSYDLAKDLARICKYNKCLNVYILNWGTEFIIGKRMYNEWRSFPDPRVLLQEIKAPIKIICAGKNFLVSGGRQYFKHANSPKAFIVIKNAGHTFDEVGAEEKLFSETLEWVKKYSR